jgi:circadian clock protein KaiC
MSNDANNHTPKRLCSGIDGIDDVLGGGLTPHRMYLVEGAPGTGKTTLALQFLLKGVEQGEAGLYITLSETRSELISVADSHGWDLGRFHILELLSDEGLDPQFEQTVLHPAEVELGETVRNVIKQVEELKPARIVLDSLSELRLLSQNTLRYRRQILALKRYFATRACTVLLLDDNTSDPSDVQLHSIAHGVISLDNVVHDYGGNRRRMRIAKMRGIKFREGYHDFSLDTGGIKVYPRLVAADHKRKFEPGVLSSDVDAIDALLGGGLARGSSTILIGPAGTGKSTLASQFVCAAARRGTRSAVFVFDELRRTMIDRADKLGMEMSKHIEAGTVIVQQIDPAEMSPGELAARARKLVESNDVDVIVFDSLNGYMQSMPAERYLYVQLHELLTYFGQLGVTTVMLMAQSGIVGEVDSPADVSYIADSIVMLRYFEAGGRVRKAI